MKTQKNSRFVQFGIFEEQNKSMMILQQYRDPAQPTLTTYTNETTECQMLFGGDYLICRRITRNRFVREPLHDFHKDHYFFLFEMGVLVIKKRIPRIDPVALFKRPLVTTARRILTSFRIFSSPHYYFGG